MCTFEIIKQGIKFGIRCTFTHERTCNFAFWTPHSYSRTNDCETVCDALLVHVYKQDLYKNNVWNKQQQSVMTVVARQMKSNEPATPRLWQNTPVWYYYSRRYLCTFKLMEHSHSIWEGRGAKWDSWYMCYFSTRPMIMVKLAMRQTKKGPTLGLLTFKWYYIHRNRFISSHNANMLTVMISV